MKYAVLEIKGKQFKVEEGQEILIDKLSEGEKPEARVLLVVDEKGAKIGNPTVKGAKITLKVVENEVKGTKIHVYKFKSKSRYRRKIGSRPVYTKLFVSKFS